MNGKKPLIKPPDYDCFVISVRDVPFLCMCVYIYIIENKITKTFSLLSYNGRMNFFFFNFFIYLCRFGGAAHVVYISLSLSLSVCPTFYPVSFSRPPAVCTSQSFARADGKQIQRRRVEKNVQ